MTTSSNLRRQLNEVFAYKAEWLKEDIFSLFTTPSYFPELLTHYPCVLIGGRGTGKTTVLRGLSYEGRLALEGVAANVSSWDTFGLYYRIDTNRVTAFQGPEATPVRWQKLFAHYFNLLLADILFEFVAWHSRSGTICCKGAFATTDGQVVFFHMPGKNVLEIQNSQYRADCP